MKLTHNELKRCFKMICAFPNEDSFMRLNMSISIDIDKKVVVNRINLAKETDV